MWEEVRSIKTFLVLLVGVWSFLFNRVAYLIAAVCLRKPDGPIREDSVLNRKSQETSELKKDLCRTKIAISGQEAWVVPKDKAHYQKSTMWIQLLL